MKAARTERAPLAVAGTSIRDVRRYSPDVMVKAGQVGKEPLTGPRSPSR
jgi:predicted fused transcriptional regulator/phosphomethylpyrimidine kinase